MYPSNFTQADVHVLSHMHLELFDGELANILTNEEESTSQREGQMLLILLTPWYSPG